jgi:hypothetical protein
MRRPITYAELLLILFLIPFSIVGTKHLYEFVEDRITIEIRFKEPNKGLLEHVRKQHN